MSIRMQKKWHYLLFIIFIILGFLLYFFTYKNIQNQLHEDTEQVKFSQLSVCIKNGESVRSEKNSDGSSLYILSAEMERIFVCGLVQTPRPILLTVYLYKGEDENAFYAKTSPKPLQAGSFILDVRSTDRLETAKYRADLYRGRNKLASVQFLIEK